MIWDADEYKRNFFFVPEYGEGVVELLAPAPGMSVLDLGCGNGTLTAKIAAAGARVTGLDASPEMLVLARRQYPGLDFRMADATDFSLNEQVDAVFSNATLHWIPQERQPAMLRCVSRALKPRGRFVAELGGKGNTRTIHEALLQSFAEQGLAYSSSFYFPSIGQYAPLLEAAGFRPTYAAIFDRPTRLNGENGMADWIRMFIKSSFQGLAESLGSRITARAVELLRPACYRNGSWYGDYVRLRFVATKLP